MMMAMTNTLWLLMGAMLIFFMQAGFSMMETGYTRAKNASNIVLKSFLSVSVSILVFWFLGFSLMFNGTGPMVGGLDFFTRGDYSMGGSFAPSAFVLFQTVYCAAAVTIVLGAMAERTKLLAFILYGAVIALLIFPVSGHWIWGGGWLSSMGFHDYTGAAVVHMVGGGAAFFGAKLVGPRIGKYNKEGQPRAIPGHNLTQGALGILILWFCWFGLTAAAEIFQNGIEAVDAASPAILNTNLAAAAATLTGAAVTKLRYKKPDISVIMNCSLAGLVAVSSGADVVSPLGSILIGAAAAAVAVFSIEFIERKAQVDDPVGASSVHGVCGMLGVLMTGLLSTSEGLLYGKGIRLLGVQLLGIAAVGVWIMFISYLVLQGINNTVGLRIDKQEEVKGLNTEEYGTLISEEDLSVTGALDTPQAPIANPNDQFITFAKPIPVDEAVPVAHIPQKKPAADKDGLKMTLVSIITKESKFESLKSAMDKIGITGMTVTQVMGCGVQRGNTDEFYRGVPLDMTLLPKVKVDIVICKVPLETVIKTAKKVLYSGHIGDGKIFVYDVENVIKVRTGEEGFDALQDEVEK